MLPIVFDILKIMRIHFYIALTPGFPKFSHIKELDKVGLVICHNIIGIGYYTWKLKKIKLLKRMEVEWKPSYFTWTFSITAWFGFFCVASAVLSINDRSSCITWTHLCTITTCCATCLPATPISPLTINLKKGNTVLQYHWFCWLIIMHRTDRK